MAALMAGTPVAKRTSTLRRTRSAASAGIVSTFCPILQGDRLPLDIAELAQSFAERADTPNGLVDGAVTEDAHRRDPGRSLGLSDERRGEHAEGASDEGAPVHY